MSDQRLRDAYRQVLERRAPADRSGCVTPERIMALVERTAPEEERLRTLDHVMACPRCREEFELMRAVAVAARRPEWRSQPALALAATLAVAVLGAGFWWLKTGRNDSDVLRGSSLAVTLVAPTDEVSASDARRLVWRSVPGAASYLVEIIDPLGTRAYAATVSDTTVSVPGDVLLTPGNPYQWWVRATRSDGSVVAALPKGFSVRP